MTQLKWTERTFNFDFPAGLYPELIERLRGTPARVAERLHGVDVARLNQRRGNKWSIQEHVGHLADLDEILFMVRVDEYVRGVTELLPADMTNQATERANHNAKPLSQVMDHCRAARKALVDNLERLDPALFPRSAYHPRLKVPMRLVDLMFFQAEHDDHHLASISGILRG